MNGPTEPETLAEQPSSRPTWVKPTLEVQTLKEAMAGAGGLEHVGDVMFSYS